MTWLSLSPSDVWFFRDGRPFTAGQDHGASTLLCPSPFTIQGALRSLLFGHAKACWSDLTGSHPTDTVILELRAQIGDVQSLGAFSMAGPIMGRWRDGRYELLVPRPEDAYVFQMRGRQVLWRTLRPAQGLTSRSNWPDGASLDPLLPADPDEKPENPPHNMGWLDEDALRHYLLGEPFGALSEAPFVLESRTGVALDPLRRRPHDQMLYNVRVLRACHEDTALLVELPPAFRLPADHGILALGGEGRTAHYRVLPPGEEPRLPPVLRTRRLKLLLLTPAYFSAGWQPRDGCWTSIFGGQRVRLVAAALGRPVHLGGWDMARRWHKTGHALIPPGSVYFFEAEEDITPPARLTETPDTERLPFDAQGCGVFVCGAWLRPGE